MSTIPIVHVKSLLFRGLSPDSERFELIYDNPTFSVWKKKRQGGILIYRGEES
jgi:hypothetical protein